MGFRRSSDAPPLPSLSRGAGYFGRHTPSRPEVSPMLSHVSHLHAVKSCSAAPCSRGMPAPPGRQVGATRHAGYSGGIPGGALYLGPPMRKKVDMLSRIDIVMALPPDWGRALPWAAMWRRPGKERVNGDEEGGIRRLHHQLQGVHRHGGGRLRQQAGEPERHDQEALGVREEAQAGKEIARRPL